MFAAIISSNYRPLKIQFESIYIVCQHDGAEKKNRISDAPKIFGWYLNVVFKYHLLYLLL